MKGIDSYFSDFLSEIRLTSSQREDLIRGHKTLRERLNADYDLNGIIVTTFLQGSYRRSTAIRPLVGKRADVDIIVVTNLDRNKVTPQEAIDKFIPFVKKHYDGKYRIQGRSIGIELSYVDLDIVVTSAPSEIDVEALKSRSVTTNMMLEDLTSGYNDWRLIKGWHEPNLSKGFGAQNLSEAQRKEAEWKLEPLYIPNREAGLWEQTHPLEQIKWTRDKNKNTNGHYVNVVKALKWWRTLRLTDIKHPKGYPVEHMIGDCCPDGLSGMAEGICNTLENIVSNYKYQRNNGMVPSLYDRGVPTHNVWKRISQDDFNSFYDSVCKYAKVAREALDAPSIKKQVDKWRELFGDKFPNAPDEDESARTDNNSGGGFSKRTEVTTPSGGRFA
ncbi:SMODS domain-containing nucleotidyltransferase [Arachidicoccus sp.]|uniref:SMODS domain-containing nucleotidyltransferase n=1 Tax=Arachidicoccus sp. TaxID=1872624 RepID=UPI003D1F1051